MALYEETCEELLGEPMSDTPVTQCTLRRLSVTWAFIALYTRFDDKT